MFDKVLNISKLASKVKDASFLKTTGNLGKTKNKEPTELQNS